MSGRLAGVAGAYGVGMLRVGLTGGIGAGKSTVARLWAEQGALLLDADAIAREVVEPGSDGLAAVVDRFGPSVLDAEGALDRPALGRIVFDDAAARADLEAILHPRISARTEHLAAEAVPGQVVVHDIPLLVELDRSPDYHLTVVVHADEATRMQRLMRDRGMAEDEAQRRIASQADEGQRRLAADEWLVNDDSPAALEDRALQVWCDRVWPWAQSLAAGEVVTEPSAQPGHDAGSDAEATRVSRRIARALGLAKGPDVTHASRQRLEVDAKGAEWPGPEDDRWSGAGLQEHEGHLWGSDPARAIRVTW